MHASAEIGRQGTYVQRNAVGLDPQPQMLGRKARRCGMPVAWHWSESRRRRITSYRSNIFMQRNGYCVTNLTHLSESCVHAAAFPFNESRRIRRLKTFGILDTPAEEHFDSITKVAASLLQAPIALLNFIDETREWCKSAWGMKRRHAKRSESLCAEALAAGDVLVILNAAESVKYRNHPQ